MRNTGEIKSMKKYFIKATVCLIASICVGLTGCDKDNRKVSEENNEINIETVADEDITLSNNIENESIQNDEENSSFYQVCTNYSKNEVEDFAENVKQLFLKKSWEELGEYVSYPITIGNITCENKEEFSKGEFEQQLTEEFYTAVEKESCIDMFCSWRGIMFSQGEIWIGEVLDNETSDKGELKIIAIKGKDAQPEKVEITKG